MSTHNSRKKTRINVSATLMIAAAISPESCHYITRAQAYSGNEIAKALVWAGQFCILIG
jgi:hypothetical protein